jgi:hypothetical protein
MTAKLDPKTPVEIWFQDEMRLGQKNPYTRRWARRGTRPRALADLRTKSAYLCGAICPKRGTGAAILMPRADTEAMQHHSTRSRVPWPQRHMRSLCSTRPAGTPRASCTCRKTSPCCRCHPNHPSSTRSRTSGNFSARTNCRTGFSAITRRSLALLVMLGTASSPIRLASPQSEPASGQSSLPTKGG